MSQKYAYKITVTIFFIRLQTEPSLAGVCLSYSYITIATQVRKDLLGSQFEGMQSILALGLRVADEKQEVESSGKRRGIR